MAEGVRGVQEHVAAGNVSLGQAVDVLAQASTGHQERMEHLVDFGIRVAALLSHALFQEEGGAYLEGVSSAATHLKHAETSYADAGAAASTSPFLVQVTAETTQALGLLQGTLSAADCGAAFRTHVQRLYSLVRGLGDKTSTAIAMGERTAGLTDGAAAHAKAAHAAGQQYLTQLLE